MTLTITSIDQIDDAAHDFLKANANSRWFAFLGDMGAGKTTFIRALCRQLGVEETVTSPSFAIVNEYKIQRAVTVEQMSNDVAPTRVFHFDFYRLRSAEDVLAIGIDEYFRNDAYCFMEWPQIAEAFLPDETVVVRITQDALTGTRTITTD